jgi:hypothetical protein
VSGYIPTTGARRGKDGNTVTSEATLRIDSLVDVRDAQGQIVPILQVCTESGTEY